MSDKDAELSEEAILKALDLAKERAVQAERGRAELDRVIAAAREEQRLLQRLLDVRRNASEAPQPDPKPDNEKAPFSEKIPFSARASRTNPAMQTVIDELATASRPLHISELMRLLRDRGVPIPGAGTQANLITHLRRDHRLVRTSRGMYGLATWGLERMEPVRRTRTRRRRVRTTAK
jgi:hypothetical protein